jgi:hypothetical protein
VKLLQHQGRDIFRSIYIAGHGACRFSTSPD